MPKCPLCKILSALIKPYRSINKTNINYGEVKKAFEGMTRLYHFTKFDTAIRIIENKALKFGRLSRMNDINESSKIAYSENINTKSEVLSEITNEIYAYRQLSFSKDAENSCGFALHQMWGHYGDKGNGVCFVFGKDEVGKSLAQTDLSGEVEYGDVNHDEKVSPDFISNADTIEGVREEINKHRKKIFFRKSEEWKYEQEFRVIRRCPEYQREEYLPIGSSLKFIIINDSAISVDSDSYLWDEHLHKLEGALNRAKLDIPILVYGSSLMEYKLMTSVGETIWSESDGFDVRIIGRNGWKPDA